MYIFEEPTSKILALRRIAQATNKILYNSPLVMTFSPTITILERAGLEELEQFSINS
jgi:hypothetical protein